MEISIKAAWLLLAALHATPAMSAFAPGLIEKLYGITPEGDTGILLIHRGALFLAVCLAALYAAFSPESRRLASLVLAISMIGYLIIYVQGGSPAGGLQNIAIPDAICLIPLFWVSYHAWR